MYKWKGGDLGGSEGLKTRWGSNLGVHIRRGACMVEGRAT
jgi:hypothetical protein